MNNLSALLGEPILDLAELAEVVPCSPRTLRRYEQEPDGLPCVRVGRKKFYRVSSVKEWLERRETKPNPTRGRRRS